LVNLNSKLGPGKADGLNIRWAIRGYEGWTLRRKIPGNLRS